MFTVTKIKISKVKSRQNVYNEWQKAPLSPTSEVHYTGG